MSIQGSIQAVARGRHVVVPPFWWSVFFYVNDSVFYLSHFLPTFCVSPLLLRNLVCLELCSPVALEKYIFRTVVMPRWSCLQALKEKSALHWQGFYENLMKAIDPLQGEKKHISTHKHNFALNFRVFFLFLVSPSTDSRTRVPGVSANLLQ